MGLYRYVPSVEPHNLPDITWNPVPGNMGHGVETAYGDFGRALVDHGAPYKRLRHNGMTTYLRRQGPPTYRAGKLVAGHFVPTPSDGCDFFPLLERVHDDAQAKVLAHIWVGLPEIPPRGGIYRVADVGDDPTVIVTREDVCLVVAWSDVLAQYRQRLRTEPAAIRAEARRRSALQLQEN